MKTNYDGEKMYNRYFAEKNLPVFFITKKNEKKKPWCLPKAEFNTKNSTKQRRKASFGGVFGVQFDSLQKN